MKHQTPRPRGRGVWDLAALTTLGLDPESAGTVLRRAVHLGLSDQPALPDEDLERALLDARVAEGVPA